MTPSSPSDATLAGESTERGAEGQEEPAGKGQRERSTRDRDIDTVLVSTALLCLVAFVALEPRYALYAVATLVLLTPCILLHEWGHYATARRAGMQIKECSLGFGPRILSRTDRQGVRWSIKAVPLGGSVEIGGMTVEDVEASGVPHERAFVYASTRARLRVVLTGVAMNLLLAWVAFTAAAIGANPAGVGSWRTWLTAPLAGALAVLVFTVVAALTLVRAVTSWDADVSSIFSMPLAIETGVAQVQASGDMPVWVYIAMLLGLVNLSLAVFNALPFYPLDGYYAMVSALDGVRRRWARHRGRQWSGPLRVAQLRVYTTVTLVVLVGFVGSVIGRDLIRVWTSG